MVICPPEKLGSFYLGARYEMAKKQITAESINYDSRDLTTHAVCVGMTGSGKTGLCIGLLEEAAIDQVPAIIIDPKGDMTNLMLQFEGLNPNDFKPWINVDDAARKGMNIDEYAGAIAEKWDKGLASWGQDMSRIELLKNSVEYTIYTPGSNAGIPINIMGSFAAPNIDFEENAEMLRERIQGTVAALLGMIESKEDPVRSREGILLANLFEDAWRKKEDLDLASLIKGIQKPPMQQLGVFDVDTFFPEKDRFDLAMDFNSLIASPQFKYWLEGEDLDIEKLYFNAEGKPKHSIIYIAHLSESERMFFVTLLLNSLVTWMRRQSGTTSLRSLLYFDEIFGYFPPTAEPPSKKPLLTILKQARAYGVGAVLVTQNPVDIDYKGLSNAGTWFIGKLQTERDKMRVLDGLENAISEAGGKASLDFSKIISSLSSRVFLMHNVHEQEPVIYHTRWAMSYLRGPLTRPQVKKLMQAKKETSKVINQAPLGPSFSNSVTSKDQTTVKIETAPSLDPKIIQRYFSIWKSPTEAGSSFSDKNSIRYVPQLMTTAKVRFYDEKRNVDLVNELALLSDPPDDFGRNDWGKAIKISNWQRTLFDKPDHPDNLNVNYDEVPASMNTSKEMSAIEKEFSNWLYQTQKKTTLEHAKLKIYQSGEESEESFKMRLLTKARELRDEEIDKIHEDYEEKFQKLESKIRKELRDLDEAEAERRSRKNDELINVVETVFGGIFGRRRRSMSGVSTKRRMARKAKEKVLESKEDLAELDYAKQTLEQELNEQLVEITDKWNNVDRDLDQKEIKPRRADVKIDLVMLVWYPYWVNEAGQKFSAV